MPGGVASCVYARVGLLGNPSDGFYGKTISFSLKNFYAEVTHLLLLLASIYVCNKIGVYACNLLLNELCRYPNLVIFWPMSPVQVRLVPAAVVSFQPHQQHDPTHSQFASLDDLARTIETQGYYGGIRLLMVRGQAGKLTGGHYGVLLAKAALPIIPGTQCYGECAASSM